MNAPATLPGKLHDWRIPQREYDRQIERRGRRHAFERIDPKRTALAVVDMVPFFAEANAYCRGIVANVNRLANALRAAGGTVAWIAPSDGPPHSEWHTEFYGAAVAELYRTSGGTGPVARRLIPGLAAVAADLFVEKSAASAFFPGRCDLAERLRARAADTVLIAGTVTNVCVEGTARDAATLGLRAIVVADATAARDDAMHNASLTTIYRSFGDVRPTDEVLDLIECGLRPPSRPAPP